MKIFFRTVLLAFVLFGLTQAAYSCSCFRIDNKDEIESTEFIFVGKVVEIAEDKSFVPPKIEGASAALQAIVATRKRYLVKFRIENEFKGVKDGGEITLVKYEQENSMCAGLKFEKNKTYLIYAGKDKDGKEISDNGICSRTQIFDKKSEDYRELLSLKSKKRSERKKS